MPKNCDPWFKCLIEQSVVKSNYNFWLLKKKLKKLIVRIFLTEESEFHCNMTPTLNLMLKKQPKGAPRNKERSSVDIVIGAKMKYLAVTWFIPQFATTELFPAIATQCSFEWFFQSRADSSAMTKCSLIYRNYGNEYNQFSISYLTRRLCWCWSKGPR